MRFRLLLFFLPVLLGACAKTSTPVQLDFIGTTTLTSGSKVVSPNDTLTTRAYAVGNDNLLKRLTISVNFEPGPTPIIYPVPLSSFDPSKTNPPSQRITYLDSLIKPVTNQPNSPKGGEYLFENRFSARSTSGKEQWQYTATDVTGETASRAYLLTARKTDSAAVYHSYTVVMRPLPGTPAPIPALRDRSRVFLGLAYGLLLPRYAVLNDEASVLPNQQLIDLICTTQGTSIALNAPAYPSQAVPVVNPRWPNRRATMLRRTTLSATDYTAAVTAAAFNTALGNGQRFAADSLSTGTLALNQVVAFRTVDGKTGLLMVSSIVLGTAPLITCTVKVSK